jgi:hypothetical protein
VKLFRERKQKAPGYCILLSLRYAKREKDKRRICIERQRVDDVLVASLAALCSSQLVHLCYALLEFFVLALFVRVSFVLFERARVRGLFCIRTSDGEVFEDRRVLERTIIPRTSRASSIRCVGSGSAGSRGGRRCLCKRGEVWHRTFPRGRQL